MSLSSPSSNWQPPAPEQLDEWLERYTVRALIGRGGMGAVYLAWQGFLDRAVALKLLPAELGVDTGFVKRFEREAKAMARLDHPNIVRVFDFGRTEAGHFYFVMEYVDGCDIAQLIRRGEVPVREAMDIVTQLCAALGYAHGEGIIHRDIKPSNILLDKKGRVKIADFGLARPAASSPDPGMTRMTESGMVMGTLEYMAPEQLMGKRVDHRADLYAVGVLFYELLTGDVPRGAWRPPSNCRPMDSGLDQVVQRALQPKPEERYQQAGEVQRDLTTVLQRRVPPVRPPWRRRVGVLAAAGLSAAAAGTWWWMQHQVPEGGVSGPNPGAPEQERVVTAPPLEAPPPAPASRPTVSPAPQPAAVPPAEPAPAGLPAAGKIESAISLMNQLPGPEAAPEPTAALVSLPPLPQGSLGLLDFAKPMTGLTSGTWEVGTVRVETDSLFLTPAGAGPGSVTWKLPDGPVDLTQWKDQHWQIDAQLTAAGRGALLLTLEDAAGRTRSWRIKPESFFEDRVRRHAHRLPLAEADLKSPAGGVGPRLETAGFDLSRITKIRLESGAAEATASPAGWRFFRVWLLPSF